MSPEPHNPVEVFYSYAHEDEDLQKELKKHLSNLKRQGVITDWYDRDISAGTEWNEEIENHLNSAKVILLLISPDFMDSDYINDVEVKRAMERHELGEARVIPVILRPVDWQGAPFSKLQALPTDAKPVRSWDDPDEAFLDITRGIRKAILELSGPSAGVPTVPEIPRPPKVGFVSRRDKDGRDIVERLREELAPEKNQLVALWGAGGVGKTTLAAAAVRAAAEARGQRVLWVSADARPNFVFSTLLDDIAGQLGRIDLRPLALAPKEDALRLLISAKPTLIVLDNLETISPQEESACTEFLAKRVHCPALITTRERIEDALVVPIAAMSLDEAREFLKRLAAQTHDAEIFANIDSDRILGTAEFNPLIIQWIVAQIDLAGDPEEVLSELARGEGDAAQRVFDRSFDLPQMADGGRTALMALSLFTPSAGRGALAEVAGMGKDRKKLKKAQQTLASLWLITTIDAGQRLLVDGLTRELSRLRLTRDNRLKSLRQRYITRFVAFVEANSAFNVGNLNALEQEKENVLNALYLAFESNEWLSVLRIADVLAGPETMLATRGYWDDGISVGRQAMLAAKELKQEGLVASFAANVAGIRTMRGEYSEARQTYLQALANITSDTNVATVRLNLGMIALALGELPEASENLEISLRLAQRRKDLDIIAPVLGCMGSVALIRGNWLDARNYYNDSLAISEQINNLKRSAEELAYLAHLEMLEGNAEKSKELYSKALGINQRLGHQRNLSGSLRGLGGLALREGNLIEAQRLLDDSLQRSIQLGDQSGIASTLHELGRLSFVQSDYASADKHLRESAAKFKQTGDKHGSSECLESIGDLRVEQKLYDEAINFYHEASRLAEALGDKYRVASIKRGLGLLWQLKSDMRQAKLLLSSSLAGFEELGAAKANEVRSDLEALEATSL